MYKQKEIPFISKDLMDFLDETFPERCPDRQDPEREIWINTGKRELVRYLRSCYEKQNINDDIKFH